MSFFIDDVSRILASPLPRRQALKMAGTALAGIFLSKSSTLQAAGACGTLKTACGTKICCVTATEKCCTNGTVYFCALIGATCCGTVSCPAGQTCCRTGTTPFCAPRGNVCCGTTSCSAGESCCGSVCCAKGLSCYKGRCYSSQA